MGVSIEGNQTTTQVDRAAAPPALDLLGKGVKHLFAIPLRRYQSRISQHLQVVRQEALFDAQRFVDFTHVLGAREQSLDHGKTCLIGQHFEQARTGGRLAGHGINDCKGVLHQLTYN